VAVVPSFGDFDSNVAFDGDKAMTADFSLQLSKSIANFIEYKSQSEQGYYNVQYWSKGHKITRGHGLQKQEYTNENSSYR
jgi:hypothetical protein